MSPLDLLADRIDALAAAAPDWGWHVARAWPSGRAPTAGLAPWLPLAALGGPGADGAARLGAAIDRAAAASGSAWAEGALVSLAGHLLPAEWAPAVDDLVVSRSLVPPPDPLLGALLLRAPDRAAARVVRALDRSIASRLAADTAYAVAIAADDAGVPLPAAVAGAIERLEAASRFLVDEAARTTGRLRRRARSDLDAAWALAEEAVVEVGADDVYAGLWAVLARSDPERAGDGLRRLDVGAQPVTAAVLADLCARLDPEAARAEVERQARDVAAAVMSGALDGRRAWPSVFRLLTASVATGDAASVGRLLALVPPAWAVELAVWRPLRRRGGGPPDVRALLDQHATAPFHTGVGPLEPPPPPPWADLDPVIGRARLGLLADPEVPMPSGYPWGEGPP